LPARRAGSQEKVLMADFIAVIRRAVDGLSNNTPEMRARVYEKARAAVVRQLENMSPRPPEHMLQRQLDKLDAAIREVEAEHAEALPAVDTEPAPFEDNASVSAVPAASAVVATADAVEATPVESIPAWAQAEPQPEPASAPAPQQEPEPEHSPVEPASSVSGDDWADEHMAEPAQRAEPEIVEPDVVYEAPTGQTSVDAEPVSEPEAGWRVEPSFAADDAETDYARLYERPVDDAADVERAPSIEPEAPVAAEADPFREAPTAEESWSRADEPETSSPAWDAQPFAATAAEEAGSVAADVLPAAEAYPTDEPHAAAIRVDSVEDWLQSRAQDVVPTVPAASWDLPIATETAANRVPELPEIDARPASVSYTPTDEFPAYEEPVRVEPSRDFVAPEGLNLPDADPSVLGPLGVSTSAAAVQPDDFSQWFQDNAEEAKAPPRAGDSTAAPQAPLAPSEWDEHIDSFSSSAKGATVETAAPADGMEALVGGYGQQPSYRLEPKKRRNFAPMVIAALVLVLLGGGGYLAWSMRDDIGSMVANLTGDIAPADETTTQPATTPAATETPAEAPAQAPTATAPPDAPASSQKFTQRLQADGSEIDEGAGSAPIDGAPAEGRSVSAQTVASTVEPTDPPPAASNGAAPAQTPAASGEPAAVPGGEKLFLYEERIGQATPVAVPGSISWTAVRENGPDGKPDPQIQGRINVPERGISALLTVKRNTDNSLPASHIIEVVFSVPPDFEGGAIENLQRIAMKRTEQDRGDPLVAVTAKVTDDTYLVALNDFEDVVKRNMELLSTRGWIDIPITYRNGRRALITLDKGTTGGNVFQQVMREWAALAPAAPAN
jgi:hypothetical protein